jgi:hypothetical protein
MSLLTEKQIAELACIASNQSTSKDLHDEFCEWNEKQTSTQFVEPDWGNAPDNAVSAVAHLAWVTKIGNWLPGYEMAKFERPAPVIKPHPHAEMIMKYAEVAQRRADPWVEFEIFGADGEQWVASKSHLQFHACCKYRHIGETK